MVEKRQGLTLIKSFRKGVRVVGMVIFKEELIVATEHSLYSGKDPRQLKKMKIKEETNNGSKQIREF